MIKRSTSGLSEHLLKDRSGYHFGRLYGISREIYRTCIPFSSGPIIVDILRD